MRNYFKKYIIILIGGIFLNGCVTWQIKGITNTNHYKTPTTGSSYVIENLSGSQIIAPKIMRMLDYQMQKLGLLPDDKQSPDYKVLLAFDVVPEGTISTATTFIYQPQQTTRVVGNTFYTNPTSSSAITTTSQTKLYTKSIAVQIQDTKTGKKLWAALTTETGWCNQIFVTTPHILSTMFDDFPSERTNVIKEVKPNDKIATEFKNLFPRDTNWSCK